MGRENSFFCQDQEKVREIFKFCVKASEKSEGILNFTLGQPLDFGRKFHGSYG